MTRYGQRVVAVAGTLRNARSHVSQAVGVDDLDGRTIGICAGNKALVLDDGVADDELVNVVLIELIGSVVGRNGDAADSGSDDLAAFLILDGEE